jgi:hypothetical protein
MRVLLWHVHGSWTTAFAQGEHELVVPVLPDRGPDGRGRAQTWDWPESVVEVMPADLPDAGIDVVVLQRPHELYDLCERWAGLRPGRDVPAVYLEHNAPQGRIADMRHPAADVPGVSFCHVTHFNALFWDCGRSPIHVIEHGIVDPGHRYTGELARAGVVINEARRRGRVTGTDLLPLFQSEGVPIDLFGMDAAALGGIENLQQDELHRELARRRVYVHPHRWTSLGLSLIEAMHLGMPVAALATTEVVEAVPPAAGTVSTDVEAVAAAAREFLHDLDAASAAGQQARTHALERFGLARFLEDWDQLLKEVTDGAHSPRLRAR